MFFVSSIKMSTLLIKSKLTINPVVFPELEIEGNMGFWMLMRATFSKCCPHQHFLFKDQLFAQCLFWKMEERNFHKDTGMASAVSFHFFPFFQKIKETLPKLRLFVHFKSFYLSRLNTTTNRLSLSRAWFLAFLDCLDSIFKILFLNPCWISSTIINRPVVSNNQVFVD